MSTFDEALKDIKKAKSVLEDKIDIQPKDPSKGHFYVSLAKSFIRIGAGAGLVYSGFYSFPAMDLFLIISGGAFMVAEVLGIVEELV